MVNPFLPWGAGSLYIGQWGWVLVAGVPGPQEWKGSQPRRPTGGCCREERKRAVCTAAHIHRPSAFLLLKLGFSIYNTTHQLRVEDSELRETERSEEPGQGWAWEHTCLAALPLPVPSCHSHLASPGMRATHGAWTVLKA